MGVELVTYVPLFAPRSAEQLLFHAHHKLATDYYVFYPQKKKATVRAI